MADEETVEARLVGDSHEGLKKGEVTELSQTAFEAFSDKFVLVEEEENEDSGSDEEDDEPDLEDYDEEDFPVHKGAGWYLLSNGEKVQGKDDALEAQEELGE